MAVLTILLLVLVIIIIVGIAKDWKSELITILAAIAIVLSIANFAILANRALEEKRGTFKIVKVDSIHIYKVNETADSLIIEDR